MKSMHWNSKLCREFNDSKYYNLYLKNSSYPCISDDTYDNADIYVKAQYWPLISASWHIGRVGNTLPCLWGGHGDWQQHNHRRHQINVQNDVLRMMMIKVTKHSISLHHNQSKMT